MLKRMEASERLAVSVEDAAAMAGIGRTTLYAALGEGSLRSLKIGKRRLIPVDALRTWILSHEQNAEAIGDER